MLFGLGKPSVEIGAARPAAGPELIFVLAGRVDHAGDVAGAGQYETHRTAEEFTA